MPDTFIKHNFDTGVAHAYEDTGSHFERRCGSRGVEKTIYDRRNISKISLASFFERSDACQRCRDTFDTDTLDDIDTTTSSSDRVSELQQIAADIIE